MLGRQQVSSSSIINDSENDLKYLALDKKEEQDICEYPDSDKVISRSNNTVIIESLFDKKRTPIYSHNQANLLEEIGIYTHCAIKHPNIAIYENALLSSIIITLEFFFTILEKPTQYSKNSW